MLTMGETIGRRITKFLAEKKMTQGELSRRSGVERAYINQLIHGKAKNVGVAIAQKLAIGFGISTSELLGEASYSKSDDLAEYKTIIKEMAETFKVMGAYIALGYFLSVLATKSHEYVMPSEILSGVNRIRSGL